MRIGTRLAALTAAVLMTFGLGTGVAAADPRSSSFTWVDQNGTTCKVSGTVAASSSGGYVSVLANVACDRAGKDGTLNITDAKGPNGKATGIGSPWCTQACSTSVRIPYTGPGTYLATIYYWDDNYAANHGHDPRIFIASSVSS
jgi:hypothetical protein